VSDERAALPYGDVAYADPGYQADKKKRYPIDTAAHAKSAWSYINQASNAAQYSSADLAKVKSRIMAACRKFGIDVGGSQMNSRPHLGSCVRAFNFEMEPASDGRTLEGHAAVFNSPARIRDLHGDFDEIILPGAFRASLERRTPVMQFEHGRDPRVGAVPIAAISDIHEDEHGLFVRARLFDNPVVEPVRQAIEGGAIKGMSFRFQVPDGGDTWSSRTADVDLRQIADTDTSEIGPVVFPAYDTTSVTVRSLLAQLDPDEHRTLIRELAAELRHAADLTDLTGRPTQGVGGGDPGAEPEPSTTPALTNRLRLDDGALRLRGILK